MAKLSSASFEPYATAAEQFGDAVGDGCLVLLVVELHAASSPAPQGAIYEVVMRK